MRYQINVAWPYANGELHLGHLAGCLLPATIWNDYLRLRGRDVVMVSGSDMHGTPVAVRAWKENMAPADYAASEHKRHLGLLESIGMHYSLYTHTATGLHAQAVQLVFQTLFEAGYIFKEPSEQFWSEIEHKFLLDRYIEGECPNCHFAKARGDQCDNCGRTHTPDDLINPYSIFGDKELKKRKSTNYYLDLQKIQPLLEASYKDHPNYTNWRNHVQGTLQGWLAEGLKPRAISRDMDGYGVALPVGMEIAGEEGKIIYVWFEAVTGYLTATMQLSALAGITPVAHDNEFVAKLSGLVTAAQPGDLASVGSYISQTLSGQQPQWEKYWLEEDSRHYYYLGKDNIPFHTVIWPAMLVALREATKAPLALPWDVPANQYLNLRGGKFSKSSGVGVTIRTLWEEFGGDPVRYFLTSRMPEQKDYDFTWEEFIDANNNELLANLGNLCNRVMVFWGKNFAEAQGEAALAPEMKAKVESALAEVAAQLEGQHFAAALQRLMVLASEGNKQFNDREVWKLVKTDFAAAQTATAELLVVLANLATMLQPFLPDFAGKLRTQLGLPALEEALGQDYWQVLETIPVPDVTALATVQGLVKKLEAAEVLAKYQPN